MKRTVLWAFVMFCGCTAWSSASAASLVWGLGQIDGAASSFNEYENPAFLDVAKTIQVPPSQTGSVGDITLSYSGQGQFGRLGVQSHIGGPTPNNPIILSSSVDFALGFQDEITGQNLSSLVSNFLRLEVELSGDMTKHDFTSSTLIGGVTNALFEISLLPLSMDDSTSASLVEFVWFGDSLFINNEHDSGNGFVSYPGEEPQFGPQHSFSARGYVDIPLNGPLGSSFVLMVAAKAHSSCSTDGCVATSDFGHTALIGGARVVDQNGNTVPGASFTSASGYDYITPPGPLGGSAVVPEPASMLLAAAGLAVAVLRKKAKTS